MILTGFTGKLNIIFIQFTELLMLIFLIASLPYTMTMCRNNNHGKYPQRLMVHVK